jgi:hypothetical protein
MNHKRKRPKPSRAGCLLCKPNKLGKGMEKKLGHRGFGKLRKEAAARQDLAELAKRITARNRYADADFGVSAGREFL